MAHIQLLLRNPQNPVQKFPLIMDLFEHKPITAKWLELLKENIRNRSHLDKSFCFLGFPEGHRNVETICRQIEYHKSVINAFSASGGWRTPYVIEETYSSDSVIVDGGLNQDLMNRLHHHFEILSGQTWNVSEYKNVANFETRYAIHRLNLLCHELESLVQQFADYDRRVLNEKVAPSIIYSYLTSGRLDLVKEDFDSFEFFRDFGLVNLHYAQIGKRWDEAYYDQDEHVFDTGISGLRYCTGEFNVYWGEESREQYRQEENKIRNWIQQKGGNPNDPQIALGWIHVGQFDRIKNFGDFSLQEIHRVLARHMDIEKIEVVDDQEIVSQHFDYSDTDEDYEVRQMQVAREIW